MGVVRQRFGFPVGNLLRVKRKRKLSARGFSPAGHDDRSTILVRSPQNHYDTDVYTYYFIYNGLGHTRILAS